MDPISGSDQLVLLLRQKLLERTRTSAPGRANSKLSAQSSPIEPNVVQALAALEGADERSLRRALIQFILADQLGASLINDAQFQQVVSRVTDAIEEDPQTADLLSRVVEDLLPA